MTTDNAGAANPGQVMPRPADTPRGAAPLAATRAPAAPPRVRRTPPSHHRLGTALLVAADCAAAGAAAVLPGGPGPAAAVLVPVLGTVLLLGARSGLYRPGLSTGALEALPRLLGHCTVAWCVAAVAVGSVHPQRSAGWAALAGAAAVHTLSACAARAAVHLLLRRVRRRRRHSALVVGADTLGRRVVAALHEHPEYGMLPVGLVCDAAPSAPRPDPGAGPGRDLPAYPHPEPLADPPVPALASYEDIVRAVIQNAVQDAVFTRSPRQDPRTAALAGLLAAQGCTLWLVTAGVPEDPCGDPDGDHLWGFACRRLGPPPRHRAGIAAKRCLDLAAAGAALVLTSPLLLVCAAAVRLSDGPGVIFRQERVGQQERPFTVLKFRTLRPASEHESATLWNVAHDRRMSTVGRVLRRTCLDELPQLWNVLRGDMSLVGPRPERPYFVHRFSREHPGYAARHRMPAGITGLAQIHGLRGDTSIEDRARFDNHYIDTWSFWQDVRILLRTACSVVRFRGGRR